MTDKEKLDAIRAEIHRLVDVRGYDREMANDLFTFMGSLPNEPVSEDLEEAVNAYIGYAPEVDESSSTYGKRQAFRAGAKWQKEKDAILPKVWNRKNLDDFSYQTAYDLSNDWAKETPTWDDVEKACKLGSEWQKEQDQKSMEIMDEVYFKSCDMIRKQMITKACKYLQEHREEVETEDNGISGWISDEFIEDFENYMKD